MSDRKEVEREDENKETLHWTSFLCHSCAVYYGINSLVKVIKSRTSKKESVVNRRNE